MKVKWLFSNTKLVIKERSSAPAHEAPVGCFTVPALPLLTHLFMVVVTAPVHGTGPAGLSAGGDDALRIGPAAAAAVSTPISASTGGCGDGAAALSVPAGGSRILALGQLSTKTASRAPK